MSEQRFITFEGGEGSGKSTQARLLAERLAAAGHDVALTREPGGAPFAEDIRTALLTPRDHRPCNLAQALAFFAARADHLSETIRPALQAGRIVICDRFSDSTRVYQTEAGDLPLSTLRTLDSIVVGPTQPGLTFIIDIDPVIGLARAHARTAPNAADTRPDDEAASALKDMFEARDLAYHHRLRAGFLTVAAEAPERCVVIAGDAHRDAIAEAIWRHVAARIGDEVSQAP